MSGFTIDSSCYPRYSTCSKRRAMRSLATGSTSGHKSFFNLKSKWQGRIYSLLIYQVRVCSVTLPSLKRRGITNFGETSEPCLAWQKQTLKMKMMIPLISQSTIFSPPDVSPKKQPRIFRFFIFISGRSLCVILVKKCV